MIRKKILLLLFICCGCLMATAQLPQRQVAPTSEPSRVNSVFLGVSGGLSSFHFISQLLDTHFIGYFGQAGAFVFVTENITLGADYAYLFFNGKDSIRNFAMDEVLISGAFHFDSPLNLHISLGFGYYGEPDGSHFGLVPSIGIMPRIAKNIYFKARGSAAFFDIGGQVFKIEAGLTFMVFQHKPIKR